MVRVAPGRGIFSQDAISDATTWWHEHANLCLVAACIAVHDTETRARMRELMDASLSRGEELLAKVLENVEIPRRPMAASGEAELQSQAPVDLEAGRVAAQLARVPLSGMNRFCETMNASARVVAPRPGENPPAELLPSRKYTKKSS
jgi:hypothetical protein